MVRAGGSNGDSGKLALLRALRECEGEGRKWKCGRWGVTGERWGLSWRAGA